MQLNEFSCCYVFPLSFLQGLGLCEFALAWVYPLNGSDVLSRQCIFEIYDITHKVFFSFLGGI